MTKILFFYTFDFSHTYVNIPKYKLCYVHMYPKLTNFAPVVDLVSRISWNGLSQTIGMSRKCPGFCLFVPAWEIPGTATYTYANILNKMGRIGQYAVYPSAKRMSVQSLARDNSRSLIISIIKNSKMRLEQARGCIQKCWWLNYATNYSGIRVIASRILNEICLLLGEQI